MATYNLYCETDGWVTDTGASEPTACPNDAGHSVRAASVSICPAAEYQLEDHPTETDKLIVCQGGEAVNGKTIVVGEAEIQGDSRHNAAKGPVIRSATKVWRLTVDDAGTVSAVEVV